MKRVEIQTYFEKNPGSSCCCFFTPGSGSVGFGVESFGLKFEINKKYWPLFHNKTLQSPWNSEFDIYFSGK